MADDRRKAPPDTRPRKHSSQPQREERPFDVWLNRQLHAMYDDIAHEPLPRDVLELIERDGRQVADEGAAEESGGHQSPSESEDDARDKH